MSPSLRKYVRVVEAVHAEGGRPVDPPILMIGVAAVLRNPWAGLGYVDNLRPQVAAIAPRLGAALTAQVLALAGGGEAVAAYGKAAVVGADGEIEHASALIHTLRFGNPFRQAVGAKTYLAFTNTRGGPGAAIHIPLMHKHDEGARSHYLTVQMAIADAPAADEVIVALGAATGGRAHPRIGDRYQDIAEMRAAGEDIVAKDPGKPGG